MAGWAGSFILLTIDRKIPSDGKTLFPGGFAGSERGDRQSWGGHRVTGEKKRSHDGKGGIDRGMESIRIPANGLAALVQKRFIGAIEVVKNPRSGRCMESECGAGSGGAWQASVTGGAPKAILPTITPPDPIAATITTQRNCRICPLIIQQRDADQTPPTSPSSSRVKCIMPRSPGISG